MITFQQQYTRAAVDTIATTSFNAVISRSSNDGADPGVMVNNIRYGYNWIAIGTKDR